MNIKQPQKNRKRKVCFQDFQVSSFSASESNCLQENSQVVPFCLYFSGFPVDCCFFLLYILYIFLNFSAFFPTFPHLFSGFPMVFPINGWDFKPPMVRKFAAGRTWKKTLTRQLGRTFLGGNYIV